MSMTDEQLRLVLDQEIEHAETYVAESIREEQLRNAQYYLGLPMGNEVRGRSQVVSWDVFEIVESAVPGFIEPFFSSDNIGEFEPKTPDDEAFCDQATDYVNHVIKARNPGFLIFSTWIKDALLSKIGVVRADWEDVEPKRRQWQGLSDEQLVLLAQDERVQIIEHSAYPMPGLPAMNEAQAIQAPPPMRHDVTLLEKQPGCVKIENVRPENFIISRGASTASNARVIGEWVVYTRGELKELGVSDYMDVQSYGSIHPESLLDDDLTLREGTEADPSLEEVRLFKGFVKADYDRDGISEWREVLVGGGQSGILLNEEADGHNYCIITPIPIPHRVIGMAYADPARQIQDVKTALTRQYLDSLYLANRPRLYVNTEAGVSVEDILSDRIGGIIRGRGPAANALTPIQTAGASRDALEGLQLADGMRETRLGIPKINPGLEADALHKTATGTRHIAGMVDKRQKMTLRTFAETGIKDLFRLVLRLITKYQDVQSTIRLRGEWVSFDPRQWSADLDCTISVGVGTSDETETMLMLQQFFGYMQAAMPMGIVRPENMYEFGRMLAKNARLKGADTKLLTDPRQNQMPQQPDPAQAQLQIEQMKAQVQAQAKQFEAQLQAQVDENRQRVEAEQQQARMMMERELAQFKAHLDAETKQRIAMIDAESRERIAQMNANASMVNAQVSANTVAVPAQDAAADAAISSAGGELDLE